MPVLVRIHSCKISSTVENCSGTVAISPLQPLRRAWRGIWIILRRKWTSPRPESEPTRGPGRSPCTHVLHMSGRVEP
eukprot:scaffold139_cov325-Pavlova_lutheri.AAC.39